MSVPLSAKILKSYETYTCNGLISSARIFLLLTHFQIFSYLRLGVGGGGGYRILRLTKT